MPVTILSSPALRAGPLATQSTITVTRTKLHRDFDGQSSFVNSWPSILSRYGLAARDRSHEQIVVAAAFFRLASYSLPELVLVSTVSGFTFHIFGYL